MSKDVAVVESPTFEQNAAQPNMSVDHLPPHIRAAEMQRRGISGVKTITDRDISSLSTDVQTFQCMRKGVPDSLWMTIQSERKVSDQMGGYIVMQPSLRVEFNEDGKYVTPDIEHVKAGFYRVYANQGHPAEALEVKATTAAIQVIRNLKHAILTSNDFRAGRIYDLKERGDRHKTARVSDALNVLKEAGVDVVSMLGMAAVQNLPPAPAKPKENEAVDGRPLGTPPETRKEMERVASFSPSGLKTVPAPPMR